MIRYFAQKEIAAPPKNKSAARNDIIFEMYGREISTWKFAEFFE
jgi:hypothetical protein